MKGTKLVASFLLTAILAGCGSGKSKEEAQIITVDVNVSYPTKELVLQDFMDVEYIPLETNEEFVTQGGVMAVGDKYILVKNWIQDGDIFVFDRKTGKGLRKINRKGQGAEEYTYINGIILDEANEEMFVNSASQKKIFVYDLSGNYKRYLNHTEGAEYLNVFQYDKDHLIRYDMSLYYKEGESRDTAVSYHAIISKQDGSITRSIPIPFDKVKAPVVQKGDGIAVTSVSPIIPYQDNWLLVETSSDTVYCYLTKEDRLSPFLVKTSSQDPERMLTMGVVTDRYYFMQTIEKVFDFSKGRGFPSIGLVYDKQENAIFQSSVLNNDWEKQHVSMTAQPVSGKIAALQTLAANKLVEAYRKDQLKGKLKEIAAELNEESNPVIMLMKTKK